MAQPFRLKFPVLYDTSSHSGKNALTKPLDQTIPRPVAMISRAAVALYHATMRYLTFDVVPDASLKSFVQETRAAEIPLGVYSYMLQGRMDKQIDVFVKACRDAGLVVGGKWQAELPPFADVEVDVPAKPKKPPKNYVPPLIGKAWADQVHEWLIGVEQSVGVRPGIYTAQFQWAELLSNGIPPAWTADYLFWVKYYPFNNYVDLVTSFPPSALPKGVKMEQVIIWQYHDKGRSNGFDYNDLNTLTERGQAILDAPGIPDPEPDPVPVPPGTSPFDVLKTYELETLRNGEVQITEVS